MIAARTPPASLDIEARFLACCFLDGAESFSRGLQAGVATSVFHDPRNRLVFERMAALVASGKQIDLPMLVDDLTLRGELAAAGGYGHLMAISETVPCTVDVGMYAERLVVMAQLRAVITHATAVVERAYAYTGEGVEVEIGPSLARLLDVATGKVSQEPTWSEVVTKARALADEYIQGGGPSMERAISFGWPQIDRVFGPLMPGQLVIIAARPSVGKSSLLRPIALEAAKQCKHVLFPTLEVRPQSVALQMATLLSGFNPRYLHRAHKRDQQEYLDALEAIRGLPLDVTNMRATLASIVARSKALHAIGKLDLLVIDYLGLIHDCDHPNKGENKASAIGRVTKALKRLAQELDIPVVVACQLNRGSVTDGNREPRLSDLRDSGDIEQDADKVVLIHRPDTDEITGLPQSTTDDVRDRPSYYQKLIQAKGRDDGTHEIAMYFDRALTRFRVAEKPRK